MKIYFSCSMTGGRQLQPVYQVIVQTLKGDGHDVPTAHLADAGVMSVEAVIDPFEVYSRNLAWIRDSNALIAEVSVPSHGVGYEIGQALGLEKPVLALYESGISVSKMITGNPDPNLWVMVYENPQQAVEIIRTFLSKIPVREKRH